MGRLWELVEQHRDSLVPYRPSIGQVSRQVGFAGRQGIAGWRDPKNMPSPELLRSFSVLARLPYLVVLDAALVDCGYLAPGEERRLDRLPRAPRDAWIAGHESDDTDD